MTAFASYAMQIVMSFMVLVFLFIILPRTVVSANRINEVLDQEITIKDGNYIDNNSNNNGSSIVFNNVSFSYTNDDKYNVSDLSFEIEKGKTTAIIGPTGSGKTTIVNLLSRMYDVTKGEILIDGINVKDYKINDLESKIAIASQKAMMLKGTVLDNITYGDSDSNIELRNKKIDKALKVSQSNFIIEDQKGLEKEVAQGGTNFSGGQKQRLSIARTLYKNSNILVFDDTFSALDFKTDMLVRKGINDEYKDKTIIIIAQRIGTIKNADKIIVLNDGKIDSIGTHEELINKSELYKDIALSQLEKEEL
jgi:ATP-binding cassette subfamily B protein